jgi:hypothetical protein
MMASKLPSVSPSLWEGNRGSADAAAMDTVAGKRQKRKERRGAQRYLTVGPGPRSIDAVGSGWHGPRDPTKV